MDHTIFIALSQWHWARGVYFNSMWPDCALVPLNARCGYCCVWCASFKPVHPAGICLRGFYAFFLLTKLPSNIFHSGSCSEERVTVCRITCSRGKKSLKIFKHPLLPLLHFCILNLTPTNVIWRLGYFCGVRQSSLELVRWPLLRWWALERRSSPCWMWAWREAWPEQVLSGRGGISAGALQGYQCPSALHSPCSGHICCGHCLWIFEITIGTKNHMLALIRGLYFLFRACLCICVSMYLFCKRVKTGNWQICCCRKTDGRVTGQ